MKPTPLPQARPCTLPAVGSPALLLLVLALAAAQPVRASTPADLTTLSLERLMELTVVGAAKYEQKQRDAAAAVSLITRAQIKAFGWRTLDEALASLPGVHTTYDRQYRYFGARGFGLPGDYNTRLLVTINGNRVNDPAYDSGPIGGQFPLDIELIERIEYIPGPGGAVYGQNAMFGVVNVITRDGDTLHGVELSAGLSHPDATRRGRASWGWRFDNGLNLVLSASGQRSRGEDLAMDFGAAGVSGMAAGLDGERGRQFFGRLSQGPWSFEYVQGQRRKYDPTGAYLSDPLVAGQYQGDGYTLSQLQYQADLTDLGLNLSARLFAGAERYTSRLRYGTWFSFPARSDWRGFELRVVSTAFGRHKLMAGVEVQDNHRIDQRVLDADQPANDRLIRSPGRRSGLFMQDEWRIHEHGALTMGLRVDHNDWTGTQTSPRAALIWQATPAATFKALYGRAHRAPNAYERDYEDGFAQAPNPSLKGESIETLEAVADLRVNDGLALRASLYQWTMHDLVTLGRDIVSGLPQYQSGGEVKARGMELSLDRSWRAGQRLEASVSLQDTRHADGARLLNSPRLLGKLKLSAALPWAGLTAGYELRADGPRLTQGGNRVGGHLVSNLHLSTSAVGHGLELSLGVQNLFDKRYAHPGADTNWQNALEQDGRSLRLGAGFRF